jgi:tetratricopeptide (TPR) repeat protein
MKILISLLYILFLLVIPGCSMLGISKNDIQFKIISNPENAYVYLYDSKEKKYIELGKTPLLIDKNDKRLKNSALPSVTHLMIAKEGYTPESIIWNTKILSNIDLNINLKHIDVWANPSSEAASTFINDVGRQIKKIYSDIRMNKLDQAKKSSELLQAKYPKASIFYDIKGSLLMLEGKNDQALLQYEKSLALDPNNEETQNIIKFIKARQGRNNI